eukprot:377919_1
MTHFDSLNNLTTMRKVQENDIGALLSKMRERQSNIRQSLDNHTLKRTITPSWNRNSQNSNVSSISSSCNFENRLQRIRAIRQKFENQYSILRESTHSTTDRKSMSLSLPLTTDHTPTRAQSARLKHSVSASKIQYPLTSRDDLNLTNNEQSVEEVVGEHESKQDMQREVSQTVSKKKQQNEAKKRKQSIQKGKHLGNLPENIYFGIFQNLDAITLAKISCVCDSWYHTILQSIRYMFSIPFQSYPMPNTLKPKTIFITLKKLHFINSKSCSELLFWSCARGYDAFLKHFITNMNQSCHIQIKLPSIKHNLNAVSKIDAMTSLHIASKHNQLHIVKILLTQPTIDVNKLTKSGKHAITIATQRGHYDIVSEIMNHVKMNVNQTDQDHKSLLHIACSMGNVYTVNQLLSKGADPNPVDKENRTPLYIAAENGYVDVCKCLLSMNQDDDIKVDVHTPSKSGKSPLYAASENGHVDVVSYLLSQGANVRQETCRGKIALYAAAEKQFVHIVKHILPYTKENDLFKLTHYGTTAMFIASKQSNKTVKKMLVAFCMKQQKVKPRNKKEMTCEDDDKVDDVEEPHNNDWLEALNDHHGPRLGTPKFAEQFETFQELKQKRKRNSSAKTTSFLERMTMANVLKVDKDDTEEKDRSVPRNTDHNERKRVGTRYHKPQRQKSQSVESKEQDQREHDAPVKPQRCAFDYNRLYKGKLRHKPNDESRELDDGSPEQKENRMNEMEDETDPDQMLLSEEVDEIRKEKKRVSQEAVAEFMQRQKEKTMAARRKAQERINEYKNKDMMERKKLIKKREEARQLAMKVAEKIAQRSQSEDLLKFDDKSEAETQSDPCLNLFDKLRRKEIMNGHFQNESECEEKSVLDTLHKEKKRSLEVTGRILNVLSNRNLRGANGYGEDMMNDENEMYLLHPLSKKKKKKWKKNMLEHAYGIKILSKAKKRKMDHKSQELSGLLQIATIAPGNRN